MLETDDEESGCKCRQVLSTNPVHGLDDTSIDSQRLHGSEPYPHLVDDDDTVMTDENTDLEVSD